MGVRAAWRRIIGLDSTANGFLRESAPVPESGPPFRFAFEQHPVAMGFLGPDLRFLTVNAALCSQFGYTQARLQTLTVSDLVHPDDAAPADGVDARSLGEELCARVEKRFRTRTGDVLWGELTVTAVLGGNDDAGRLVIIENITERKRMEDALRNAHAFRERIMEADTNAIGVIDGEGKFRLASQRVADISGYSVSELIGRTFQTLLPESELARVSEQVEATLTRGVPVSQFESEVLRKDGSTRTVTLSLQPLVLEDGRAGVVGTAEDVTELRHAELALRNSEDRYRDLVENSGVLIGTHDLEGRILSANQSLVRLAGCERAEELIGTILSDYLAPEVRHLFPGYLKNMREVGHARGVMKVLARGGELRILEYDNSLRHEGLTTPIVRCFGHDVTERVRATKALRASEARYRALYEDNPAMYFTVDPTGIILSVNQFGAEQLGYAPSDLVGQTVLRVFHEDDRAEVVRQMEACLQNPAAVAHWELRKVQQDGCIVWVREAARAVTSAQGRTEVFIVCEDITERRRTEQALRDSEARLRALGDNLPNGAVFQIVSESDGRMHFPYMSAGIRQLLGVTAEEAMRDARVVFDLIVEEDRPRLHAAIDESVRLLCALDIEVRMRALPDLVKWMHFRSAPRRLPDGGTVWDGVQLDVTNARRDLEALLQTAGAIVWEAEGDIAADVVRDHFVSQQAERLLGYPISDWLEQPTFRLDHIHTEDRPRVVSFRREAIAARRDYELDYRMIAQDGRTVWLRDIISVVAKDDQRVKLRGITVDVTESKRVEAALRESEERFRTLAETMPAALLIYRGDQWVYVNPAAEAVTGYTRDELLSMKIWELVHPQSRALVVERLEMRQRGEPIPRHGELRMLTKAGREHWIEIIARPITFQGQASVLVTGFDVTERAQAEAALRDSKEALRRSHERARELTGKLMLTQEEERRRISRELHDDVNQKVAALAIIVSRLKHEFPESADVAREQLTGLQNGMTALSEDVRQLSHQLHPAALEHIGLVNVLKSHCAEFSSREGIAVSLAIREGSEAIPLDMALCLYRVTQESLRNIAKHAGTRQAQVTLAATTEGVSLSIADSGIGFDPERVRRKGGLGLVSMEERVRLLRGMLRIRSQPGGGTELHVHVPFNRE